MNNAKHLCHLFRLEIHGQAFDHKQHGAASGNRFRPGGIQHGLAHGRDSPLLLKNLIPDVDGFRQVEIVPGTLPVVHTIHPGVQSAGNVYNCGIRVLLQKCTHQFVEYNGSGNCAAAHGSIF